MQHKPFFWLFLSAVCFFTIITIMYNHKTECHAEETVTAPMISRITVGIKDWQGDTAEWIEMANPLIYLREGEPFSKDLLQKSVSSLTLCNKFREIHVDSEDEGGKMAVIFTLTPFYLIKDIKIDGASPLFEREILNVMTIYTGDTFDQKEISRQKKLITSLYEREGFMNPGVSITTQQQPDNNFIIHVNITPGRYYNLRHLRIEGNQAFSDQRLKLRMKIWLSSLLPRGPGRFVEENLKKDIKELITFYRKKKYPEVNISHRAEKKDDIREVSVILTIAEGPRYDVEFVGNEEFWNMTLKKDVVLFTEGNQKDLGIRKSLKAIKKRYHEAGYLEADIKIEDRFEDETSQQKGRTLRHLRFVITEGPQSLVQSVEIAGNHLADAEKIRKQMLTRVPGVLNNGAFVPETLKADIEAIKAFYLQHGYMNTEVREDVRFSDDKTQVAVRLDIEEGSQTLISDVKIIGCESVSETEAGRVLRLKKGEPFQQYKMPLDENDLAALVSEKGHPHVSVSGEASISDDLSEVQVVYTVREGPYVETGEMYYTGNFRTKEKILENEIEMESGEPFSLVRMLETQRNIRDMDVFNSVQFKAVGLKEEAEKVHLFVEMEEKKPYFIEVGTGYDTERNFYVHAETGDHNLFGANKNAWVGGEISQIGYEMDSGITEPRLFGTRISSTLNLFAEKREEFNQDFGTRAYGTSLGFNRKWFKNLSTGLNFKLERREQFEQDNGTVTTDSGDEYETRSIWVTTPSISYDNRDSFVRPGKGFCTSFSVDVSKGFENSLDNFFKYRFDTRVYWTPLSRLTFACYGRAGYIDPYGSSDDVPDDQLFFLGGTTDVRGFSENMLQFDVEENPIGGLSAISGSLEARFDLGMNFELTGFYDIGKVNRISDDEDSDDWRSSVGMGLRYITPIGPIGFLYGFKLDPKENESQGRLHFTLGYTF